MAKRDNGGKRTNTTANSEPSNAGAPTDTMEQRLLAFAEQLGRIAGTVQAKTEGWMDRDALNKQIAGVRDSATELLEQLKTTVTSATSGEKSAADTVGTTPAQPGRGRGAVDAPGKKHRKPTPKDSRAVAARARASSLQSGKSSMKTTKRRGRG